MKTMILLKPYSKPQKKYKGQEKGCVGNTIGSGGAQL